MFTKLSALAGAGRLRWRVGCLLGLATVWLGMGAACEDEAIGRPCALTTDGGTAPSAAQGAYTTQATDCPSHLCVKPAVQPGVSTTLDTGPYCTIRCNSDTDCDGQTRDPSNPLDTRCRKGYACAPVFGHADNPPPAAQSLCCAKICLCRDFFVSSVGPATPDACRPGSGVSCP
jgi:hypothetical protein